MTNSTISASSQLTFMYDRTPQFFRTNEKYNKATRVAGDVYTLLLDRVDYSEKNNFVDEKGNTVIIYTNEQLMEDLNIKSNATVVSAKKELESLGLIEQHPQGGKRPNLIYVMFPAEEVMVSTEEVEDKKVKRQTNVDTKIIQETEKSENTSSRLKIKRNLFNLNTNTDTNTDTIRVPETQAVEDPEKPVKASEVFNNGVNNLWFEDKALNTMQRMVNGSLEGVHDLISTILNAKKRVETTVKKALWLDYNDEQTTVVIESIDRLFKAGKIKDLEAYVYNSFRNMVENRLNTQMQHGLL
ncbi:replication initiator protein A [Periweissella fabalis]|uniref:Replication initiator A N-terminal domain-containing protein n=1 Tax=Periweissella fabalis TaxID=1070421 RepID=A0A7X6N6Q8_9LACO|nr:replication initiator protein A [Periweissella fabalis]MCM0598417.1 replication initiator protein A [Periweissella fabalis]NKZ25058.1 hypothetical protein [Periweissella fabalis]